MLQNCRKITSGLIARTVSVSWSCLGNSGQWLRATITWPSSSRQPQHSLTTFWSGVLWRLKPVFLIFLSGLLLIRRDTCPGIIGAGDDDDGGLRVGLILTNWPWWFWFWWFFTGIRVSQGVAAIIRGDVRPKYRSNWKKKNNLNFFAFLKTILLKVKNYTYNMFQSSIHENVWEKEKTFVSTWAILSSVTLFPSPPMSLSPEKLLQRTVFLGNFLIFFIIFFLAIAFKTI